MLGTSFSWEERHHFIFSGWGTPACSQRKQYPLPVVFKSWLKTSSLPGSAVFSGLFTPSHTFVVMLFVYFPASANEIGLLISVVSVCCWAIAIPETWRVILCLLLMLTCTDYSRVLSLEALRLTIKDLLGLREATASMCKPNRDNLLMSLSVFCCKDRLI